ncbi:para-nitrobenzyl esterase [Pseudochelatococcus lubricantis]|uniref:Carboxylic ester hydrolase n=1 Tax=Pseudochelatococcus lubricantis TaxID=1538102 RepID=A0ABX0V3V2_9HYPH|nr:carboxylesterase family protein [Pseudochelatococcus lubricantis]NIJ58905.1 para-nitrobenzyl esterase [Pseudochelatococcus lubricantis]
MPNLAENDGRHSLRRGTARGVLRNGVECYYGLRYGRLSRPGNPRSPVTPAEGQFETAELTGVPVFPQLPSRLERAMGPGIRENPQRDEAFYLNVWTPEGADGLPVLVFLHGGAWVSGGGAARWYRGERLAAGGMVVVTLNYRLGPAGHLEDKGQGDGHRPIGDLLAALEWVQRCIRDFGGDPDRVTLAGQSAGAWYAWALAGLPAARGLFRQAALLSIPQITPWTPAYRHAFTGKVAEATGFPGRADETASEALLRVGGEVLARTPQNPGAIPPMYLPVWPTEDAGADRPLHVRALHVRITWHEMSVFLPPHPSGSAEATATLRALRSLQTPAQPACPPSPATWPADRTETIALASWQTFGRFAQDIAASARKRGCTVTWRAFAALAGLPELGAAHCLDLPFQFGNAGDWHDAPMLHGWRADDFERLSAEVRRDLADFVAGRHQAPAGILGEGYGPMQDQETQDQECPR